MTAAVPLRALPRDADAEVPPITLADAIELWVPLCFVVEPDRLWAECAIEALLEEYATAAEAHGGRPVTVARWTRTRRWVSYGASFGFALAGTETSAGQIDVLEEIVRLTEHLASARPSDGTHAFQGALFAIRCAGADLGPPLASEALLDLMHPLMGCDATLLIELPAEPNFDEGVESLGPVFRLPRSPRLRYAPVIERIRSAARAAGAPEPDVQELADALSGLTRMQAEIAARVVQAEWELRGSGVDVHRLLSAARERVSSVLRGGAA
jgi:hypothetical protein